MSRLLAVGLLGILSGIVGCGGSSGNTVPSASAQNSVQMLVNGGPCAAPGSPCGSTTGIADEAFTTVTVCAPATSNCQTISGVLVDTGSSGLRIVQSALNGLALPQVNLNGNPLVECVQFVTSFSWGPVMMADVKIAGESASGIPVQVIGEGTFSNVPAGCVNSVPNCPPAPASCAGEDLPSLGANGILGIGNFVQDCGPACATTGPKFYFTCNPPTTCTEVAVPLTQQVQNPVAMFAADNNGVILEFPGISSDQATATGTIVFGIGTQTNNALGSAAIYPLNPNNGGITTTYKGVSYPGSFLDSGSTAIFYLDSTITGIPGCTSSSLSHFYCPTAPTTVAQTAANISKSGTSNTVNFSVTNPNNLNGNFAVLLDLAGPNPSCFIGSGSARAPCFDWGLPFFFSRKVFTAIEGRNTPGGNGPYWAY